MHNVARSDTDYFSIKHQKSWYVMHNPVGIIVCSV